MIQMCTMLKVADNSGAYKVMCVKVNGSTRNRYARVGDVIKVSVKEASAGGKIEKGKMFSALVVRTKQGVRRADGSLLRFDDNAVVLLNDQLQPLGTRVFGPVCRELRTEKFMKVVSMALEVL